MQQGPGWLLCPTVQMTQYALHPNWLCCTVLNSICGVRCCPRSRKRLNDLGTNSCWSLVPSLEKWPYNPSRAYSHITTGIRPGMRAVIGIIKDPVYIGKGSLLEARRLKWVASPKPSLSSKKALSSIFSMCSWEYFMTPSLEGGARHGKGRGRSNRKNTASTSTTFLLPCMGENASLAGGGCSCYLAFYCLGGGEGFPGWDNAQVGEWEFPLCQWLKERGTEK